MESYRTEKEAIGNQKFVCTEFDVEVTTDDERGSLGWGLMRVLSPGPIFATLYFNAQTKFRLKHLQSAEFDKEGKSAALGFADGTSVTVKTDQAPGFLHLKIVTNAYLKQMREDLEKRNSAESVAEGVQTGRMKRKRSESSSRR